MTFKLNFLYTENQGHHYQSYEKIVTILLIDGNITVKKGLGDFP